MLTLGCIHSIGGLRSSEDVAYTLFRKKQTDTDITDYVHRVQGRVWSGDVTENSHGTFLPACVLKTLRVLPTFSCGPAKIIISAAKMSCVAFGYFQGVCRVLKRMLSRSNLGDSVSMPYPHWVGDQLTPSDVGFLAPCLRAAGLLLICLQPDAVSASSDSDRVLRLSPQHRGLCSHEDARTSDR